MRATRCTPVALGLLALSLGIACTDTLVSVTEIASLEVTPASATVPAGQTVQFEARPRDAAGNLLRGREIAWSTSESAVATVSQAGLVQGVAAGEATITATSEGVVGTASLSVVPPPSIHVEPAALDLVAVTGDSQPASAEIAITNAGGGILEGLAVSTTYGAAASGWLTAVLSGPSAPATLTIQARPDGLVPGVHAATVAISSSSATNSPVQLEVSFEVVRPDLAGIELTGTTADLASGSTRELTATIKDATGSVVAGGPQAVLSITFAQVSGSGTVTGLGAAEASAGVATLVITGEAAGAITLTATTASPALTSNTLTFAVIAGAPAQSSVATQPSSTAQSGVPFAQQPAVRLRDGAGNPVSQSGVPVTASIASGSGTLGGTTTVETNENGIAAFTDLSITGAEGEHTLRFGASGLEPAFSEPIFITAGAPGQLTIETQPSPTAESGVPFAQQPAVQIRDGAGNAVAESGVAVTASIASGGGTLGGTTTTVTNASGLAAFADLSITGSEGERTLQFSASGLAPVTSHPIQVTAGGPDPDNSAAEVPAGTAGQPTAITITVRDEAGNLISGVAQAIAVSVSGDNDGASVEPIVDQGDGTYTTSYTPTQAGTDQVAIRIDGTHISGSPYTTPVSVGPAARLAITTQPSSTALLGEPFEQQPVIQVEDDSGNPVGQAGIEVDVEIATGGGTLDGTTTATTDGNGVATFTDLAITGEPGEHTLRFGASGLEPVTSNPIDVTAGGPDPDNSTAEVPAGTAGQPTAITITVRDEAGNLISGVAQAIAVSVSGDNDGASVEPIVDQGDGTYTTSYTPTQAGTDQVAIRIDGTHISGSPYTTPVSVGPAARLAIITQPSSTALLGEPFEQQPVIQVEDYSGNPVGQAGIEVDVEIAAGGGTLDGTTTATTDGDGVATFTDLAITGEPGEHTLRFSASGLDSVTSDPIDVTAEPDPENSTADVPAGTAGQPTPITITVRDAGGSPVTGVAELLSVSVSGDNAGASVEPIVDQGDGTYTTSYTPTQAGTDQVAIRIDGIHISGSPYTSLVSVGAPARLAIITQPSSTALLGEPFEQQPVIRVEDAGGNPVSQAGIEVHAEIYSGGGTLGGTTTVVTDADGIATYTDLYITGQPSNRRLIFSADGLEPVISEQIRLTR